MSAYKDHEKKTLITCPHCRQLTDKNNMEGECDNCLRKIVIDICEGCGKETALVDGNLNREPAYCADCVQIPEKYRGYPFPVWRIAECYGNKDRYRTPF